VLLFPSPRASRGEGEGSQGSDRTDAGALKQVCVLIVEDDCIVAFDMQMLLEDQGARVLGPASSIHEARALLDHSTPNLAVLDVNLNGELVFPLAEELQVRGIPFIFATAYADDDHLFPAMAKTAPRLAKPVLPNVLVAQIEKMLN
jgi:DNA-binding NtrC family response regulator